MYTGRWKIRATHFAARPPAAPVKYKNPALSQKDPCAIPREETRETSNRFDGLKIRAYSRGFLLIPPDQITSRSYFQATPTYVFEKKKWILYSECISRKICRFEYPDKAISREDAMQGRVQGNSSRRANSCRPPCSFFAPGANRLRGVRLSRFIR